MGADISYSGLPPVQRPERRYAAMRTSMALVLREMVTTYGRSPGGYIWAVLGPIGAIALLSFAFSMAFRAPSLGTSFPLFYATAYLPYMLFHDVASKTASAIRFSRPLLNFGAVNWLDVIIARFLLNLTTHVMITTVVIGSMYIAFDLHIHLDLGAVLNAFAMVSALSLGVGAFNCYLFLAFPIWERIWTVLTRPLFIISGVFFLFEDVPAEVRGALWYNPLFHVTGEMRAGFYTIYSADYVSPAYCYGLGLAFLLVALAALSQQADGLVHK